MARTRKNKPRIDGRFAVQVYLGKVNGKRKYKTVYGKTQKEAENKALDVKLSIKKGLDVGAQQDTFGKWATLWLSIKKKEVSYGRWENYKYHVEKFQELFPCEIAKLKTVDFQKIILFLSQPSTDNQKPLAKSTLTQVKATAQQICQFAMENRVIEHNPVQAVKIPKMESPEPHMRTLKNVV